MRFRPALLVMLGVVFFSACHHKRVTLTREPIRGSSPQQYVIRADPPTVVVKQPPFTVTWKVPEGGEPWLIQFADKSPCKDPIIQSGRAQSCEIAKDSWDPTYVYKYYAIADGAISADPAIAHDTRMDSRTNSKAVTLFCLDFTSGSPASCQNGDPPQPGKAVSPLNVSPQDDVYFKLKSGATINIAKDACDQGASISSQVGICTISRNAGSCGSPSCTYPYKLNNSGNEYSIVVAKP